MLNPRTLATLDRLHDLEWFRNVGLADTDAAVVLTSWDEAVTSCSSAEWEDLCMEAANQYRERLLERGFSNLSRWNEVAALVKPLAKALVREKTETIVATHGLPKVFIDTVEWDIIHLAMEAEYADVVAPGFYASQGYWYAEGRFPCGWQGTFPDGGRLIIY